jgi:hypothetical protein
LIEYTQLHFWFKADLYIISYNPLRNFVYWANTQILPINPCIPKPKVIGAFIQEEYRSIIWKLRCF